MIKVNRRDIFDRVGRYRIGVLLLLPLLVRATFRTLNGTIPFTPWLLYFWLIVVLLIWAVVADAWMVYRSKREVRHLIESKINEGS